jgi:hypothetical protein
MFLCYSQSIIHFRWIYPHNAVALGFAVSLLSLLCSSRPAHDWSAGVGLAVAAAAHPLFSPHNGPLESDAESLILT